MSCQDPFTSLLMRHRIMLWRMCWFHARGDRDRCCDMFQEVSIALWLRRDMLRSNATPGEERTWVRWQARSVLDLLKRRRQIPVESITDAMADSIADEETQQRRELIDDLLSVLGPDERRVLCLQLEGYRADEIAKLMGVSRDTVYQRMHRALDKLRRVALILLALLFSTAVAVAVVPQWRRSLFGSSIPKSSVPKEPVSPPSVPAKFIDTVVPVSSGDSLIARRQRRPVAPIPHLEGAPLQNDTLPPPPKELPKMPCIAIWGHKLTVSETNGELVKIYNGSGVLIAAKHCSGTCVFDILPYHADLMSSSIYIVQVGSHPPLRLDLRRPGFQAAPDLRRSETIEKRLSGPEEGRRKVFDYILTTPDYLPRPEEMTSGRKMVP